MKRIRSSSGIVSMRFCILAAITAPSRICSRVATTDGRSID
jgi:hypothetical protein